jgi:hypothetical protein
MTKFLHPSLLALLHLAFSHACGSNDSSSSSRARAHHDGEAGYDADMPTN